MRRSPRVHIRPYFGDVSMFLAVTHDSVKLLSEEVFTLQTMSNKGLLWSSDYLVLIENIAVRVLLEVLARVI